MNEVGMNTDINTSEVVTMAADMPSMARLVATYGDRTPLSNWACTASTTTMASSTTVPMTSTRAKSVSKLRLNPATYMNANVPMSDTMIDTVGMTVERTLCRNT